MQPVSVREGALNENFLLGFENGTLGQIQTVLDLLAHRLGQPMAAFGLFNDRYADYVVTHGLEPTRSNRADVLCDVVFNTDEPVITLDASIEPHLKDKAAVRSLGTRFYAGVPVRSQSGKPVGVLCAWNTQPGRFVPDGTELALKKGADLIAQLVSAGRERAESARNAARTKRQQDHQLVLDRLVHHAAALIDDEGRVAHASQAFLQRIGRRLNEVTGLRLANLIDATAPLALDQALDQARRTGTWLHCTGRLRLKGQHHEIVDILMCPPDPGINESAYVAVKVTPAAEQRNNSRVATLRTHLLHTLREPQKRTETNVEALIRLVEEQVRGRENLAIVSEVIGPGQRRIYASPHSASFIEDLRGHHAFNPAVSICATTAEARQVFSCDDTLDETRWPNYDWLYFTHDIRSVWCAPVLDHAGLIFGVVTVFRKEAGAPDRSDMAALEESAEWAGLLLSNDRKNTSDQTRTRLSAEHMAERLSELLDQCENGERCFLVGFDLSQVNQTEFSSGYLEEMITLHLGSGSDIFRLKSDTWYCLCKQPDDLTLKGQLRRLNDAVSVDMVSPIGRSQARPGVAFKEVSTSQHILDEVAVVGRMLLG